MGVMLQPKAADDDSCL